jgi:site-specific DNA recombinase
LSVALPSTACAISGNPRRVVQAIQRLTLSSDQIVAVMQHRALGHNAAGVEDAEPGLATLRLPFHMHRRQGALILEPANAAATPAAKVDRTLVRAVVLARRWISELESGAVASVTALADREGLCKHYAARMLPLAYLAPDLVEQILSGRQPRALTLGALTTAPLPADWARQRALFQSAGAV